MEKPIYSGLILRALKAMLFYTRTAEPESRSYFFETELIISEDGINVPRLANSDLMGLVSGLSVRGAPCISKENPSLHNWRWLEEWFSKNYTNHRSHL